MNDRLAWIERLLKRNLNSISYFEKICWLWKSFFWIIAEAGAGAGAENVFFSAPAPAKNYGSGQLRLRKTAYYALIINISKYQIWLDLHELNHKKQYHTICIDKTFLKMYLL